MRFALSVVIGVVFGRPPNRTTLPALPHRLDGLLPASSPRASRRWPRRRPSPPVRRSISSTVSCAGRVDEGVGSEALGFLSRVSPTMITRDAPRARATSRCRQPIGPSPMTSTVSPRPMPAFSWAARTEEAGSDRHASVEREALGNVVHHAVGEHLGRQVQVFGEAAGPVGADHPVVDAEVHQAAAAVPAAAAAHVGRHGDADRRPRSR